MARNGFIEIKGREGGHRQFKHNQTNVVVTVQGHGRLELSRKATGLAVRQLEKAGFDRQTVKAELGI
jgi:predicted RNA binding protein YcfA (HicA-like mRNA interferase family)